MNHTKIGAPDILNNTTKNYALKYKYENTNENKTQTVRVTG